MQNFKSDLAPLASGPLPIALSTRSQVRRSHVRARLAECMFPVGDHLLHARLVDVAWALAWHASGRVLVKTPCHSAYLGIAF